MSKVTFGMFEWLDRGTAPVHQLYEERLRLVEIADASGFFCYHLAEHHGTPLGMAPSPALFLSAVAQRTKRIRLGPLVYLLPLYDPMRLIEEVCMLDQLSGGRLELGVGRGASPYELGCFGIDAAESREIFDEALAILLAGLTTDRLTFHGRRRRYDDVPIEVKPFQRPYPPLWYPTHNPASIEYAARHGFNYVGLGSSPMLRAAADAYRVAWQAHRNDPGRLNAHVLEPKIGVSRQVVVAPTDAEARAAAISAHETWYRSITKLWHAHGDHSVDGLFSWQAAEDFETILFGSPERVRDQVARLVDATGCNYVIASFAWGTLSAEQSERSLRLFAEKVMPAFTS